MEEKNKSYNEKLRKFWDDAFALSEEDKVQMREYDKDIWKELAPSEKLFTAVSSLGDCSNVLDYGCGDGWAGIIASKSGAKRVLAVDVSSNGVDTAKLYSEVFEAPNFETKVIDFDWLKNQKEAVYDGVICSNVLDVLPLETSKEIIEGLARVAKKNAKIVIGMNYYVSPQLARARGLNLVEGKMLFVEGVFRLLSLSDDEWKELFNPFFEIKKLEYFAWPNEEKETRRLFYLKKR